MGAKYSLNITNANNEPDQFGKLGFEIIIVALQDFQANPLDKQVQEWFSLRSMNAMGYGWCLEVSQLNPNQVRRVIKQMEAGFFFSRADLHQMLKNPRSSVKFWERNAAIRARFDELRAAGAPREDAIKFIASERNIGMATVKRLLYNPRSFVMGKPIPPIQGAA